MRSDHRRAVVFAASSAVIAAAKANAVECGTSGRFIAIDRITQKKNCLEINVNLPDYPSDPSIAVRKPGRGVDVYDCDTVEGFDDYVNRDMIDHWQLTCGSGQLRSMVSGGCVTVSAGGAQTAACSTKAVAQGEWALADGQLRHNPTSTCLVPTWRGGSAGGSLATAACDQASAVWTWQANGLVVYPAPDPTWMQVSSSYAYPHIYDVSVAPTASSNGGAPHRLYTYTSWPALAPAPGLQLGRNVSWTTFAFDGKSVGSVTVTVRTLTPFITCNLTPNQLNLKPRIAADHRSVSFVLISPNQKVSVEFDAASVGDKDRATNVVPAALLIFADELEEPAPDPLSHFVSQTYYGPGVHTPGCMAVDAQQTVYIAGGAYVRGGFETKGWTSDGATVAGRGVVTTEDGAHSSCFDGSNGRGPIFLCGEDVSVSGVTVAAAPAYAFWGHIGINVYYGCSANPAPGRGATVRNVKVLGWQYSADGVFVGRHGSVSDSFLRANDDLAVDFQSHQVWERNVLWQLDNGWPFLIQWNTYDKNERDPRALNGAINVSVRDSVVVHYEAQGYDGSYNIGCASGTHTYDFNPKSIFGAWQGEENTIADFTFERIAVEGGMWAQHFWMRVGDSPFSERHCNCCGSGNLAGLTFRDIWFEWPAYRGSVVAGNTTSGGRVTKMRLEGIIVEGKAVSSAADMGMRVDTATADVTFSRSRKPPPPPPPPPDLVEARAAKV